MLKFVTMIVLSLAFLSAPAFDLDNCCALTHCGESELLGAQASANNFPISFPSTSLPDVSDHHCHHSFHFTLRPDIVKVSTVEFLNYHVSLLPMGYFEQDFLRPPSFASI